MTAAYNGNIVASGRSPAHHCLTQQLSAEVCSIGSALGCRLQPIFNNTIGFIDTYHTHASLFTRLVLVIYVPVLQAATGPRAEPAQPARAAAAACMPVDPALQQLQPGPSTDPAAAAMHSRGGQYLQYGLSEMLQADAGSQHLLWHKALQLQAQHQADELLDEAHTSHMTKSGAVADVTAVTGAAQTAGRFLQRVQSSDDSSSSRMVEGSTSGRSGNDNWGPSSSSGSGAASDGADGQAQQHQQQQQLLSLFGADRVSAAAAAVQLPVHNLQQPNPAGHQQEQHPEAGQLLWQHMLLQHLQQHVQQTPGFSLPELIQVAAALFGNKVDTLVSAFGLSGPSRAACEEQEQLARLVAALRQGDCGEPAA